VASRFSSRLDYFRRLSSTVLGFSIVDWEKVVLPCQRGNRGVYSMLFYAFAGINYLLVARH
jgi:hypothetical protein